MPETSEKPKNRPVRVIMNKYFIVTVLFMVVVLAVDRNNVIRWAGDYIQVQRQEKAIRQYRNDIKAIDGKLKELTSDRDSLEKFAREQYFFQKKDEEVFIVD
ncbi:MAG TPA: septum formation initiator family protein [Candidatus Coprenecus pullistercoris]|nr:septum formation initiator family protein [Candidatus Coprenecus pullistercoris]